jgi:chromosome segregation ATPase
VEFPDLNPTQLLIAASGAGFLLGCFLSRIASRAGATEDPRNHLIRELEADLRTVRRQYDDSQQVLAKKSEEFASAVETLQELRSAMSELERESDDVREENKSSVAKMRDLRLELQDRATETIREHMRAEEAETEMHVAKAGSDAVLSEISRLQAERKQLTDTMRILEEQVMLEGDGADPDDLESPENAD